MLESTSLVKPMHFVFSCISDFFPNRDWKKCSLWNCWGEEEELSNYNEQIVELFQHSITFKDNKYYVKLALDSDKIFCVPSNHSLTLHVLDCVASRLECDLHYQNYLQVLHQQKCG